METYDLVVIGGGINGVGIARDAAGRGLKVLLLEAGDLATGTSSRSGKLVHGGLRYLEYYEFRLVREALIEREVLLRAAPHIIWPLRFVLPHSPQDRPAWLIRLGLFLYDHLGGRKILPPSAAMDLRKDQAGAVIKPDYRRAFVYSDCWVDDARLVVLNAIDAAERGARILTRHRFTSARRGDGQGKDRIWRVSFATPEGAAVTVAAKGLVNAAGPWVQQVLAAAGENSQRKVRLVKGSHIITRKFWPGDHNYLLQNTDRRVIFVNQYLDNLALIGTTDIPYGDEAHPLPPENVAISEAEISYLLDVVNRYFVPQLGRGDVLDHYAGVRPLYDDTSENPSAVTRDYVFDVEDAAGSLPILSIFGGKITTYRKLSEHSLAKLSPYFPQMGRDWTATAPLPGGDFFQSDFAGFLAGFCADYPWLPTQVARHLARLYGTRARAVMGEAKDVAGLGRHFGHGFYEAEARYLIAQEWAVTPEDILQRRTKYGLLLSPDQQAEFATWLAGQGMGKFNPERDARR
ncbi:MAG: glycerol-3-phosphate dehydrogenase [Candidatus Symbiobacter sp.]|nr:glycerol-3-phosphate dehydrogenase [Candidatus Symbiobacter sp.]